MREQRGNVRLGFSAAMFAIALLGATACDIGAGHLSDADLAGIERLRMRFGQRYEFKVDDLYLCARRTQSGHPTRKEAEALFQTFWMNAAVVPRTDGSVVYLNVYDSSGRFSFQLFWDPGTRAIRESLSEHY